MFFGKKNSYVDAGLIPDPSMSCFRDTNRACGDIGETRHKI